MRRRMIEGRFPILQLETVRISNFVLMGMIRLGLPVSVQKVNCRENVNKWECEEDKLEYMESVDRLYEIVK